MNRLFWNPRWFLCFLSITFALVLYLVLKHKGISQLGNVFSFFGGLLLLFPMIKQLTNNGELKGASSYFAGAGETFGEDAQLLAEEFNRARERAFVEFEIIDVYFVVAGVVCSSLGFLLAMFFSESIAR